MQTVNVSIIITFYNGGKHVLDCLTSVLKTTCKHYEVIIIDDNSDDKSKQLLAKHRNNPIVRYKYLTSNAGISKSRNIGAQIATGNYLLFLDIDCHMEPGTLTKMVTIMENNPNIGILQPLLLHANGTLESAGHFLSIFGLPYNNTVIPKNLSYMPVLGGRGTVLVRKSVFNHIGGYDPDHRLNGEDTDLSWRINLTGKSVCCALKIESHHHKDHTDEISKRMLYRIYYAGAKTSLSSVLKNSQMPTLLPMAILCVCSWLIISIKTLLTGKFQQAVWVYQGLWWNVTHLRKTLKKRATIQHKAHPIPRNILFGPLSFIKLISRAFSWGNSL